MCTKSSQNIWITMHSAGLKEQIIHPECHDHTGGFVLCPTAHKPGIRKNAWPCGFFLTTQVSRFHLRSNGGSQQKEAAHRMTWGWHGDARWCVARYILGTSTMVQIWKYQIEDCRMMVVVILVIFEITFLASYHVLSWWSKNIFALSSASFDIIIAFAVFPIIIMIMIMCHCLYYYVFAVIIAIDSEFLLHHITVVSFAVVMIIPFVQAHQLSARDRQGYLERSRGAENHKLLETYCWWKKSG